MSESLSIGILCFPSLGGSGVVACELAVGLARRGHRVHLLSAGRPSRPLPPCERLAFHSIEVPDYPLFPHAPYELAAATRIVDVAREHGMDVLHAHYAVPHAPAAMLARMTLGDAAPAIVTTLHGTDVTRMGAHPAYRSVIAHTICASEAVTVPSAFLRDAARELLGLSGDCGIEVIPNFVDTDHFAPPAARDRGRFAGLFETHEEGPVLVHVSNFRPVKRVADLLDALALVRREMPARLLLVGDGPDRAACQERAAELGLDESTCFLGKRQDFVEYLRHADAFVLASECESFGLAALEALASGVPVVAYDVGGLGEVTSGDTGALVAPLDVAALAEGVLRILSQPALREAMGHAARLRALEFRKDPAIERYEACFLRALGSRAPVSPEHS